MDSPELAMDPTVQSVIFDKKLWTIKKAERWLQSRGLKHSKVHTTDNYHRFRQYDPGDNMYYTKMLNNGVGYIIRGSGRSRSA